MMISKDAIKGILNKIFNISKKLDTHKHAISDVTNLQTTLDTKVPIIKNATADQVNSFAVDTGIYDAEKVELISGQGTYYNILNMGSYFNSTYNNGYRTQIAMPFQNEKDLNIYKKSSY